MLAILALARPAVAGQSPEPPPGASPEPPAVIPDAAATGSAAVRFTWENRPTLRFGTYAEINLRGRLENTLRTPQDDIGVDGDARWQTQRLEIEGTLFRRLEFEYSYEFGDAEEAERDAFVNVRTSRAIELQGGRFKIPFGRDALNSGANLDFVYRSLAGRQLSPGRDVGVMAHGRLFSRVLSYEGGYFLGDGDNSRTAQTRGGRRAFAGRGVVTPFADHSDSRLTRLQVGAALMTSDLDNQLGLRGRTAFHDGVFFDRVVVNGRRYRRGLEAAWNAGPFSMTYEHITVTDQRVAMGLEGETLPGVTSSGWYLAGTWTITGEPKRGRIEPRHPVFDGGYGALQVSARIERLAFEETEAPTEQMIRLGLNAPGNADRVMTLGTAWYLSRYLRFQINAVFEAIDDAQRSPAPRNDGRFPGVVVQIQLAI